MTPPRTSCKYCGATNCYGECVNRAAFGPPYYHSKCPHCGSTGCGLETCRNNVAAIEAFKKQKAADERLAARPLPPLPKGELIGYRCWNIGTYRTADPDLVEVGGQLAIPYAIVLRSMTNDSPWPGPVMHADRTPTVRNSNGIYSLRHGKERYDRTAHVSGSIALYGKIVEHRGGYRAEHAMIRSLTLHVHNLRSHLAYPEKPTDENTIAKQIAMLAQVLERRYECEVLIDSGGPNLATEPIQHLMYKLANGTITSSDLDALAKVFGK